MHSVPAWYRDAGLKLMSSRHRTQYSSAKVLQVAELRSQLAEAQAALASARQRVGELDAQVGCDPLKSLSDSQSLVMSVMLLPSTGKCMV